MFENLSDRLERSFKLIKGQGTITEINIAETLKDVRKALLDADVNYKIAKTFTDTVKQKALGQDVLNSIKPGQLMVKIVHDELIKLMGESDTAIPFMEGDQTLIMLVGLQGSGKTTTAGKLAKTILSKGRKPLLVAADVQRPAAIEQLKVLGQQLNIPVYFEENSQPVKICKNAVKYARESTNDVVIFDTAGRLHIDDDLMFELKEIKQNIINTAFTNLVREQKI